MKAKNTNSFQISMGLFKFDHGLGGQKILTPVLVRTGLTVAVTDKP